LNHRHIRNGLTVYEKRPILTDKLRVMTVRIQEIILCFAISPGLDHQPAVSVTFCYRQRVNVSQIRTGYMGQ
jgi:hypothetical protein